MAAIALSSMCKPLLKTVRLVAAQSNRAPRDLVLAEGLRVLEEAARSGCAIVAAVLSEEFGITRRQQALVERWSAAGIRMCRAGEDVFRSVSLVQEPQGAIALVRVPLTRLRDVNLQPGTSVLCACGIRDPGNLGTLIRSAAAAGCSLVCTTSGTVSPRNPKAVRASAGAFFRLPVAESVAPSEILAFCAESGLRVYRTDARLGVDYFEADLRTPFALLLGNEAHGFPDDDWSGLPSLRIPMAGGVESLSVAAAGAIVLFEALRQRCAASSVESPGL